MATLISNSVTVKFYVCVCIYIHMNVCICIYSLDREGERTDDRQINRQVDRSLPLLPET